jgi:ABC-type antimicrobial peptide transport system permease subunit
VKAPRLLKLARGNLMRELGAISVSAGGVALGISCLVFFLALGAGLSRAVHDVFPASTREVEAIVPSVGLGNLLGEVKIDEAMRARLAAIPGVEAAYPKMQLRVPAVSRYNGMFFGREIHMGLEVIAVGMPAELLGPELHTPFEDRGEAQPIPVVVNRRLLELYNKVFAPQRGLPRLTESMIIGFQVPIELGRSWVAGKTLDNPQLTAVQLAGFSDRATLAGVSMPLATVKRINAHFNVDSENYSSVLLRARTSEDVPRIAEAVKRMGLELDETERRSALQIGEGVELVTLALSLLAGLITLLAAVNTMQAFYASVRERRREIGILRSVGATRSDVAAVILVEAAATGLAGGVAGVLIARAAGAALDWVAKSRLPDFPFKPQSFFAFHPGYFALGLAVALLAAILGAFLPARHASRLDPARALSE